MNEVIIPPSHTQIRQELQELVLCDLLRPVGVRSYVEGAVETEEQVEFVLQEL